MRFGIKEKLFAGFAVILILFAGSTAISLHTFHTLHEKSLTNYQSAIIAASISYIEVLAAAIHCSMKDIVFSDEKEFREKYIAMIKKNELEVLNKFEIIIDHSSEDHAQAVAEKIRQLFLAWQPVRNQIIQLMNENKRKEAQTLMHLQGDDYVDSLTGLINEMRIYAAEKTTDWSQASSETVMHAQRIMLFTFLLSLIVGITIPLIFSLFIKQQLSHVSKIMLNFSDGNFDARIHNESKDEFAGLSDHFNCVADRMCREICQKENVLKEKTTELEKVNDELLHLRSNLEKKISERTLELSNKVEKLDKSRMAMLYMVEDLNSASKQLEAERQKLDATNKELETFTYSVSHDLRAPLRQIQGFAEIIKKRIRVKLDEKSLRQLNNISEAGNQMGKLIDDLLTYSRAGRLQLHRNEISTNHIVNDIIYKINESQPETRKIDWQVHTLPAAVADPIMFEQVILNLITNAVKFSSKNARPCIEINAEVNHKEIVFSISDNGVGFNMQYANKLFGVFQRLHSKEEFEGTGIGLANVQRIIHRHGGRVWAEGIENQGAAFYFTLPVNP